MWHSKFYEISVPIEPGNYVVHGWNNFEAAQRIRLDESGQNMLILMACGWDEDWGEAHETQYNCEVYDNGDDLMWPTDRVTPQYVGSKVLEDNTFRYVFIYQDEIVPTE